MSGDRDWRRGGRGAGYGEPDAAGPVPGKHSNTGMLETGDAAPHTSVPGRRTLADWFNEAQTRESGAGGPTTSVFQPAYSRASDVEHSDPVQRSPTSSVIPESPVAQRVAGEGLAGASASLPYLGAIQESFGRHDVTGVRTQVGGPADAASQAI